MRIQELERKTGLERPSIRFYEKEGLLNPKRSENGYREYSEEDVELLKKIKLLRRLGMSIDKIRGLQQGSEDLGKAIAYLTGFHSSQIDEHKRCRAVCEAIHADGAAFSNLDAEHYLTLLQEIKINDRALGRTDFQETVPKEIHPWRRYIARMLDYALWNAMIRFILIVLIRIRPIPGGFFSTLIIMASAALFIPVEALMLSKFGTTPGKFALGMRLEYYQGGNLPFSEALSRSFRVYVYGAGLRIPFVELGMYTMRYCQLTGRSMRRFARYDEVCGPQDMPWDEATEIVYEKHDRKRGVVLGLVLALSALLITGTVLDSFKPKHRGNELTVAQIAENYNATISIFQDQVQYYDKLKEDGTRQRVPPNVMIVDFNSSGSNQQMAFAYEVKEDAVRLISLQHTWDQVFYLYPLKGEPLNMAYSVLLAQDGCGVKELIEFEKMVEANLNSKSASITYGNITVEWMIESDLEIKDGLMQSFMNDESTTAKLYFKIVIQ